MGLIRYTYHQLHYLIALGGILHLFAQIDYACGAHMAFDYPWAERYLVRIEYLKRKANGEKCSFEQVEDEHLKKCYEEFQEAKRRFWEEREKHPNGNDWWT